MEEDIVSIIRDVHFLHECPEDDLKLVASMATLKDYAPGAFVFREGQKTSQIHCATHFLKRKLDRQERSSGSRRAAGILWFALSLAHLPAGQAWKHGRSPCFER